MIREFRVSCDSCLASTSTPYPYSEDAKMNAIQAGWKIGNKATCPNCVRQALLDEAEALRIKANLIVRIEES